MRRVFKVIPCLIAAALPITGLTGCLDDGDGGSQRRESNLRQSSYDRLTRQQPAHTMSYSPTRETINFWIDTWDKPGKLSYVYLQAGNGELIGYYIFKGLPVSYCAALTPTYEFIDKPGDSTDEKNHEAKAPSVDGVYYSGGQCATYYGRDATTNSYIEYTVGNGQNVLLYERPLPRQDVKPLGFTSIKEAEKR